jgi:hypothetical protein
MNIVRQCSKEFRSWAKPPLDGTVRVPALPPTSEQRQAEYEEINAEIEKAEKAIEDLLKQTPSLRQPKTINDAYIRAIYLITSKVSYPSKYCTADS